MCILFFSHNAIAHLLGYSIMQTYLLYAALGNQKLHVTLFMVIFSSPQGSGTQPTISPRYHYTDLPRLTIAFSLVVFSRSVMSDSL